MEGTAEKEKGRLFAVSPRESGNADVHLHSTSPERQSGLYIVSSATPGRLDKERAGRGEAGGEP